MKHLIHTLLLLTSLVITATACTDDDKDTWEKYKDWRQTNQQYYDDQKYSLGPDGNQQYQVLAPVWNPTGQILIKYFNDRAQTAANLTPLLNSTCRVKYIGRLCNGVAFDSSYLQKDSVLVTMPSQVIQGWTIALCNMHIGDSARIVIPYTLGYGASTSNAVIPPYSTLEFDLKLVDIPYYEIRP